MGLSWRSARLYGLLFAFILSIGFLLSLQRSSLPSLDALSAIKDSVGSLAHTSSSLSENAYQLDPPPDQPPYGAVVAAAHGTEDLSWMIFFQQNWTTYPYNTSTPNHPSDPRLQLPATKGNEALVYLTYLITNYDTLPWCAIFVHGHLEAWHQEDTIDRLLDSLDLHALARAGYVSLRCDWYPSCPAEIRPVEHDAVVWGPGVWRREVELAIRGNWRMIFDEEKEKLPETIASPCCAQFAVTRQAILRRPKDDYVRMRQWLLDTLLVDDVSGRVFEKLWAYIFTGEAVHCLPPQQCACEYFGRCERQEWSVPPEGLARPPEWP